MYTDYLQLLNNCLACLKVSDSEGVQISADDGLKKWVELTKKLQREDGTLYMAGNGASAMMASHMSLDATKNGGIKSLAFNDAAYLTALSNDLAYEEVFAFPLTRFANERDQLLTISSSGNSPNVIRAIETAKELGMKVITLSGMKPDNRSRELGDLNFYVPTETYGQAECAHQVLLHCWLDYFMDDVPNA